MTLEEWWESLAKPTTFSEHDAEFIWQAAQEALKATLDDELTAAFMMGYQAAKNDYGRNKP